jgi:hypothetical protein
MIGSPYTSFTNLFRSDMLYRDIDADDVQKTYIYLRTLGEPLREFDKEACAETYEVLAFLDKWTSRDDVRVVIQDEV